MEKVWEELKKIEAQAEQIRTDAQSNAKNMTATAQQNAEALIAKSNAYAHEEAQQNYSGTVEEANRKRDEQLKINEAETKKLKGQAETRMDAAVDNIVSAVIKEAKS